MSELLVNTIKKADGTGSLTVPAESGTVVTTASPSLGRRNLIINGAMVQDQRNGGSSVTPTASGTYTLDRWRANISVSSKFSVQQSTEAPANHTNSLLVTSLAATTVSASNQYFIGTRLEGYNIAHLKFGTADAQSITLSFWVRSSLTGTFGAGVFNSAANRCYPISYTISSANTWEQKTVTIEGDTSGTWLTNNGVGLQLIFSLGIGSTFQGTAGAWTSSAHLTASSTVNLVETNGATLYITGVQLEVGSVSTPYEHRSYGEELALCQRYFQRSVDNDTGDNLSTGATQAGTTAVRFVWPLSVPLRASPTVSQTGTGWKMFAYNTSNGSTNTPTVYRHTVDAAYIGLQVNNYSGLSDNRVCTTSPQNLTKLDFDSEL